ncbi:hypothetical protein LJC63_00750 [Ruminococcaceae bacterium OttesenSCG-928-L11]|nr:hypothetical protein [Ruminococcaceae bacterium OttesenSCG-928-L11]
MIDLTPDFVLQIQDEYTGGDVDERGILFQSGGKPIKSPLRKPGGFYVFRQTDGDVHEIQIRCPHYYPRTVRVDKTALDKTYPVIRVRMHRKASGVFRDCERIEGTHIPDAVVYACVREESPLRLQSVEAGERETRLLLQGYTIRRFPGRRFLLGSEKNGETFIVDARDSMGEYRTRDPISGKHKPGEPVVRIYRSQCDSQGQYSIPVEPGDETRIEKILHYDKEKGKWDCVCVMAPS